MLNCESLLFLLLNIIEINKQTITKPSCQTSQGTKVIWNCCGLDNDLGCDYGCEKMNLLFWNFVHAYTWPLCIHNY